MNKSEIVDKLVNHEEIIAMRMDDVLYDIHCVMLDEADIEENELDEFDDEVVLIAYTVEIDEYSEVIEYEFTLKQLSEAKEIIFYKHERV